ncbi:MAG: hypothetical protein KC431_00520, partial [Myxococcales bacterium]|nr:hypothetical protein [Myxococcales bacterium]
MAAEGAGLLAPALVVATACLLGVGLRRRLGGARASMVALAGTMVSTSAVGLILLDARALTPSWLSPALAAALLLWGVVVMVLRRRWSTSVPVVAEDPQLRRINRVGAATLLLLLIGAAAMRGNPSPYLHGGQDQGIYVNVGHHIARTGRLRP